MHLHEVICNLEHKSITFQIKEGKGMIPNVAMGKIIDWRCPLNDWLVFIQKVDAAGDAIEKEVRNGHKSCLHKNVPKGRGNTGSW